MTDDLIFSHMARNMGISAFSEKTNIPVSTLRDWNKRSLAKGIGQLGPNGGWLYSLSDVVKVMFASILFGRGFEWKTALQVGQALGSVLDGRATTPEDNEAAEYYRNNKFAFFQPLGAGDVFWGLGQTFDEAVDSAKANVGPRGLPTDMGHVIEIEDFVSGAAMNPSAAGQKCLVS